MWLNKPEPLKLHSRPMSHERKEPLPLSQTIWVLAWVQSRYHFKKKKGMSLLVAQLCPTHRDSMDCSLPGSTVHGISQQKYWSGLLSPPPGIFPTQGLNPGLLHCRQSLSQDSFSGSEPTRKLEGRGGCPYKEKHQRAWPLFRPAMWAHSEEQPSTSQERSS